MCPRAPRYASKRPKASKAAPAPRSSRSTRRFARGVFDPKLVEFRWMLEEVRVLLWARQLKTPYRTSFNRLENWRSIGVKGRSSEGMRE